MNKRKEGFTIVELVVVIAVIAIIASILIPTFSNMISNAQYSAAYQECINEYKKDVLDYVSIEDYYFCYKKDGYYFTNKDGTLINISKKEYDEILFKREPLNWNGKIVSILGDSISTFEGFNPIADGKNLNHRVRYSQTQAPWYFNSGGTVEDTYWKKLINETGAILGINDSWAGSRVSNSQDNDSGDYGPNSCMASITRITNLKSNGNPDVILYYGGTNDIGGNVTLGSFDENNTYTLDLTTSKWTNFACAYKDSIMRLQHYYPDALIVALLPTYTSTYYSQDKLMQYNNVMKSICKYFDVLYVDLMNCGINMSNLSTYLGDGIHPNVDGFNLITNHIKNVLVYGEGDVKKTDEKSDDNKDNTYYNSLPTYLPSAAVNVNGYGWADGASTSLIGKEINIISFYSNNQSGFFEIGVAKSLNCGLDDIISIQNVNWTSKNKKDSVVTVKTNNSILLSEGQYIVIYQTTLPESGAFLYYSNVSGYSFYSDVPVSRRGQSEWRLCSNYSLGIRYGFE